MQNVTMSEPDELIQVTLRCFASVREALGTDVMACEVVPGTTVGPVFTA